MEQVCEHRMETMFSIRGCLEINMLVKPFDFNCSIDSPEWIRCRCEAKLMQLSVNANAYIQTNLHWFQFQIFTTLWIDRPETQTLESVPQICIRLDNSDDIIDYNYAWKKINDQEKCLFIDYFLMYFKLQRHETTLK